MGKYSYSPDTNAKIDKICNDCAVNIILSFPSESLLEIEEILKKATHFIKDSFEKLGAQEFIIALDFKDTSNTTTIDTTTLMSEIHSSQNLFMINKALQLLNTERFPHLSISKIAKYSLENELVLIFVHNGVDITIFSKGVPIDERNLNHPSALPKINNKFNRDAIDYKLSVIDFYREKVRTNITKHWSNAAKRILEGGQTEEIFQINLVQWLKDNLSAKRINMGVKKISKDATDIEIIRHGGDTYLLELKWLGQNKSTKNTIKKVTDAIHQVENYLEIDNDLLEATLIVYDGRNLEEFNKLICINEESGNWKEISECEKNKLSFRGKAFIFHLISAPASKRISA